MKINCKRSAEEVKFLSLCWLGPKRSFVVVPVVVGIGGESWAKNVPNRTKNVHGNKKCLWEQKMCKGTKMFIKASVAHYGIEWPCMALFGLVWLYVAYGLTWSYMAFYGVLW